MMLYKKKRCSSVLLASLLVMASCSNNVPDPATPTPVASPAATPTDGPAPEISDALTPSVIPTDEITPEPDISLPAAADIPIPSIIPKPDTSCMYMNYSNAFPIVVTDTCEVAFHNDDLVTIIRPQGTSGNYHLSELISIDGIDANNPESWYFCGALQSGDTVYAHYDYLDGTQRTPSILVRIDTVEGQIGSCIVTDNPEKHFSDSFTVAGQRIYYTNTTYTNGLATTDILSADLDGKNIETFFSGTSGQRIPYLAADGNFIYFVLTNANSSGQLHAINLASGEHTVISEYLGSTDFLVALNGYVLTSTQGNALTYFCVADKSMYSVRLTNDSGINAGHPVTDGTTVYIPAIQYNENTPTTLIPVDLVQGTALSPVTLSDEYYYIVGMIGQCLYAENVDEFLIFDITKAMP